MPLGRQFQKPAISLALCENYCYYYTEVFLRNLSISGHHCGKTITKSIYILDVLLTVHLSIILAINQLNA